MKSITWNILGWILGAFSLLNLIQDTKYLAIQGKLEEWLRIYSILVRKIHQTFLLWIDFSWIKITYVETNFMIILLISISATIRISDLKEVAKIVIFFYWFAFCVVLFALLPDIVSCMLAGMVIAGLLANENNEFFPSDLLHKKFLIELAGIFGIALLLVATSGTFKVA